MAVTVQTSRFGELEITPEQIVEFPAGLIGLGGSSYTLVNRGDDAAFSWLQSGGRPSILRSCLLQSVDDPDLAIPVTDPWRFFSDFVVEIADSDADRIGIEDALEQASVWVTVRAASELEDFCANLRAPIVIVGSSGYQVINQANPAPVRAPLFSGLQEESTQAA